MTAHTPGDNPQESSAQRQPTSWDSHLPERASSGASKQPDTPSYEESAAPTAHSRHGIPDEAPSDEVARTSQGALPLKILIPTILLFIIGFIVYRSWRSQYIEFSSSAEFNPLLSLALLLWR